jgi:type VI secretion system protein ImpK
MNGNPFAEPGDDERTMILSAAEAHAAMAALPQGRTAAPEQPPPVLPNTPTAAFAELPPLGGSPVLSAAAPLLSLIARLRNVLSVPDAAALRDSAIMEMRRYEQALRDLKLPRDQIRTAHYALCASLDDVVQNTPWGSRGPWADSSLVSAFHHEVRSGDRFFELLTRLCQNAGQFLPVIELMYYCMALGMQGRYRLSPRGPAELDRVREETFLVIMRNRGTAERTLSPHWAGVAAPFRPLRGAVPVWVAAASAAGLLALLYVLFSFSLDAQSGQVFEAAATLPPATESRIDRTAPPKSLPPMPQQPGDRDALARLLAPGIHDGLVSIAGTDAVPIIRIQSTGMFASGSATIERGFEPVLNRIAAALKDRDDSLEVVGHTDNQPIHTVAFPSNFALSTARARAAAEMLGLVLSPSRITAGGRADAEPVSSNATAQGRQQNRRIEIVLRPAGAQ